MMKVWYPREIEPDWKEFFLDQLPQGMSVTFEKEPPAKPSFEILVTGGISDQRLAEFSGTKKVIVPFAGIPPSTRECLRDRPEIEVYNLHHNASSTAEMALSLLFSAAKVQIPRNRDFRENGWPARMWHDRSAILLDGKSVLIIGYGEIGSRIGVACRAMGMNVTGIKRTVGTAPEGIKLATPDKLHELLPQSNFLVVCCPETEDTRGMITETELAMLQRPALVVNVGRGPIIDEEALYLALKNNVIDGAGLDVWWQYPSYRDGEPKTQRPSRFPFHELDNLVMSPHRGGLTSDDERLRLTALAELLTSIHRNDSHITSIDIQRGY